MTRASRRTEATKPGDLVVTTLARDGVHGVRESSVEHIVRIERAWISTGRSPLEVLRGAPICGARRGDPVSALAGDQLCARCREKAERLGIAIPEEAP